ncbi:MAG: hypothetical protein JSV05_07705 [Candidatus Bathyarchaeota archaeon]|nr:MAG: hypothetical protein JSV05_07705 [Candidatus Bathyarchaeota archaeon]
MTAQISLEPSMLDEQRDIDMAEILMDHILLTRAEMPLYPLAEDVSDSWWHCQY